jgi:quinoprotein glucose dehydrogenase
MPFGHEVIEKKYQVSELPIRHYGALFRVYREKACGRLSVMTEPNRKALSTAGLRMYAALLLIIGLVLSIGGARLAGLGGSPYYGICGAAVCASGICLWQRRALGATVYAFMMLATLAWALWEAGFDGWALMPRVMAPAVLGSVLLIPAVRRVLHGPRLSFSAARNLLVLAIGTGALLHAAVPPAKPQDPLFRAGTTAFAGSSASPDSTASEDSWAVYGHDLGGTRHSNLTQITPTNVAHLALAWTYKIDNEGGRLEVTPIKIDNTLYLCSSRNDVIALDAETGKELWRFNAHVDVDKIPWPVCRGVSYFRSPAANGLCTERIVSNTADARLIALDAHTGALCTDFGTDGQVSLLEGMGKVTPGYYYPTSAPTIVLGKIIIGGWVADNQYLGEPSGVVRAYDALSGKLAWAWDVGQPENMMGPAPGQTYTTSTPNAWAPMSADEKLGLVYLPMGNPTPDYFGGQRRPFDERYTDALVALDVATGKARWQFQTVHHDLWDYDIAAQPTLFDDQGPTSSVPAVLVATKRGEFFILDRATGAPLRPVEERKVPQNGIVPEERLAPTQPYSPTLPSLSGADLVEADMWGITPLDQLWCRIVFREARYDGQFTPPGLTPSLRRPSSAGGAEWGGVAFDPDRHLMLVNSNILTNIGHLVPRDVADRLGIHPFTSENAKGFIVGERGAQAGTPYAILTDIFMSPLKVPCTQPPYGRLSAIDLNSGKLVWTRALGTAQNIGPLAVPSRLPFTIGTPNFGGLVTLKSGIAFIAASLDSRLRAFNIENGQLLWEATLPGGGSATPMTYVSTDSGRQFVVIASGGGGDLPRNGADYIAAFALPK